MSEFKVTIKKQEVKIGETKYWIRTETDEQKITFKDGAKAEDSANEKLKVLYIKQDEKDQEDKNWKKADVVVKYNSGFFFNGVKLDKKLGDEGDMKEETIPKPSIGVFASMRIPMYIAIVVGVVAIIGLIWWWISSSNKEDKEEESL